MNSRRRLLILVAFGVLLGGVAFMLRQPEGAGDRLAGEEREVGLVPSAREQKAGAAGTVAETFQHVVVERAPAAHAAPATLPLLPPPDAPLAAQLDTLLELAESGEPVAVCRLALDSLYCRDYDHNLNFMKQVNTGLGDRTHEITNDLAADLIIGSEDGISRGATFCEGLKGKSIPPMDAFLNRALPRLTTRQKILLVLSRPDGSVAQLLRDPRSRPAGGGDTRHVYSQFLADHAMEFLEEGILAADPIALEGMILVHAPTRLPDRGMDVLVSLPNPYKFAGYALLMQQLSGPGSLGPFATEALDLVLSGLPPDKLQALQLRVDAEVKRWQAFPEKSRFARLQPNARASNLCSD